MSHVTATSLARFTKPVPKPASSPIVNTKLTTSGGRTAAFMDLSSFRLTVWDPDTANDSSGKFPWPRFLFFFLTLKTGGSGLNIKPTISAIAQMMNPMTITEMNNQMHRLEQKLLLFLPGSLFLRLSTILHYPGEGSNRPDPLEHALRRSRSLGLDQEEAAKKVIRVGRDSKNDYVNVVENQAASFLRRCGPSKRIQSVNYCKSTRQGHEIPDVKPLFPTGGGTQAPSRSRARYAVPAILLGFAGFVGFLHYNDERRAVPRGQASSNSGCGCGSNTTVKGPIIGGPFTLVSTENKIVTENDFCGKWVLLYFGYSFSPDVGPEQLKMMSKAVDKLAILLNPLTFGCLYLYAEFDSRILGLTGTASAMRQMAQEYRVYFKKVQEDGEDYLVDTSHNMYLINPKMEIVRCFGVEYNPDELSQELLKEVASVSQ
ncbi:putative protein [Arabidopsis thaliana]|nr:putative protein [Arabidopsis thaliana]CAB80637.1 putative protein [Arabidopsis thaliana]